ncbi:gastrula zinc finger protein XlCGF7.1-like [Anopheles cruzii]|uniref:gastrula zinc finger protein XlCGF7.1-like n=1 Tax=Anopheles cruzii TaxID=68878 RepID=UPI0022EC8A8F|nr:gastrula zinc finger protein XlCGF7.1-like [Anopheles cruzii]
MPIVEIINERVADGTPEINVEQDAVHEAQETKTIEELESISDCARSPTRRTGKKCKVRRTTKKYLSVTATENTDEPGFVCCGCSAVQFNSQQELDEHRFESHRKYRILDNSIRPFECDMCFKRFLTEKLLVQHKTRSYRKRRFVCKSCGLAYLTNNGLKRHEKVCNVEEKNFSCEVCGKRFLQTVTLASHRKLHQQEKAFSCSVCGKTFRKKFEITIHMVTHTEEQPYPCDLCPARFKRHQALKNHQKHHVNSRPYKCDLCEESFNSFAARKFHRLTVHEGLDPFRCDHCGVSFGRRLRLTQHMKRVHGVTD